MWLDGPNACALYWPVREQETVGARAGADAMSGRRERVILQAASIALLVAVVVVLVRGVSSGQSALHTNSPKVSPSPLATLTILSVSTPYTPLDGAVLGGQVSAFEAIFGSPLRSTAADALRTYGAILEGEDVLITVHVATVPTGKRITSIALRPASASTKWGDATGALLVPHFQPLDSVFLRVVTVPG